MFFRVIPQGYIIRRPGFLLLKVNRTEGMTSDLSCSFEVARLRL
jgi:hypothetical protein